MGGRAYVQPPIGGFHNNKTNRWYDNLLQTVVRLNGNHNYSMLLLYAVEIMKSLRWDSAHLHFCKAFLWLLHAWILEKFNIRLQLVGTVLKQSEMSRNATFTTLLKSRSLLPYGRCSINALISLASSSKARTALAWPCLSLPGRARGVWPGVRVTVTAWSVAVASPRLRSVNVLYGARSMLNDAWSL